MLTSALAKHHSLPVANIRSVSPELGVKIRTCVNVIWTRKIPFAGGTPGKDATVERHPDPPVGSYRGCHLGSGCRIIGSMQGTHPLRRWAERMWSSIWSVSLDVDGPSPLPTPMIHTHLFLSQSASFHGQLHTSIRPLRVGDVLPATDAWLINLTIYASCYDTCKPHLRPTPPPCSLATSTKPSSVTRVPTSAVEPTTTTTVCVPAILCIDGIDDCGNAWGG